VVIYLAVTVVWLASVVFRLIDPEGYPIPDQVGKMMGMVLSSIGAAAAWAPKGKDKEEPAPPEGAGPSTPPPGG
jgi:hypothetical protein